MAIKRDIDNKLIAGVCAGLAKHLEVDPLLVRIVLLLSFLMFGVGPILYLILWLIMPKE